MYYEGFEKGTISQQLQFTGIICMSLVICTLYMDVGVCCISAPTYWRRQSIHKERQER